MRLETHKATGEEKLKEDLPKDIPVTQVCAGLKTWRNPVNKFLVGRLHYSADPKKRTREWKEAARAGLSYSEWMREYEIVWSSFEGVPVYVEQFDRGFHVSAESIGWASEYPVIRGWDFGLAVLGMACVFVQQVSNGRLLVLRELLASDADIYTFTEAVRGKSLEWFPGAVKWIDVVDPSGFARNAAAQDKRSYVDTVRDILKTRPVPGEKTRSKRLKSVVEYLQQAVRGAPKLMIDGGQCPVLVEGFEGGYHYAYTKDGQVKDEPEKNEFSHVHDALQYVCSRVGQLDILEREHVVPASPHYNFGRQLNA